MATVRENGRGVQSLNLFCKAMHCSTEVARDVYMTKGAIEESLSKAVMRVAKENNHMVGTA
jgi:hypothetical protein